MDTQLNLWPLHAFWEAAKRYREEGPSRVDEMLSSEEERIDVRADEGASFHSSNLHSLILSITGTRGFWTQETASRHW